MLSKAEKKVLTSLLKNARAPLSEIAKENKVTRQTVYRAMKSLEEKGVIEYYTVCVPPDKVGLEFKVYILVSMKRVQPAKSINAQLAAMEEVSQVHDVLGRYDMILEVFVRDKKELRNVLDKLQDIPEIKSTETLFIFETIKYEPREPVWRVLKT